MLLAIAQEISISDHSSPVAARTTDPTLNLFLALVRRAIVRPSRWTVRDEQKERYNQAGRSPFELPIEAVYAVVEVGILSFVSHQNLELQRKRSRHTDIYSPRASHTDRAPNIAPTSYPRSRATK
jgi:hypothetical protein